MRIVVITDWFAEKMGYAENFLPWALAAQGHEVYLVTSNTKPYFCDPSYSETYEKFLGPAVVAPGTMDLDGVHLIRLPHKFRGRRLVLRGLARTLIGLKPAIVQTFDTIAPSTVTACVVRPLGRYRLFLESHLHASVFPPARGILSIRERLRWFAYAKTMGRFVGRFAERCYPISVDAAEIVSEFFGMPRSKTRVCPLGVDVRTFRPIESDGDRREREGVRVALGVKESEILCIYTGRFTPDKGPVVLADAIGQMRREGMPMRALFVGAGPEETRLAASPGSVVRPFVPAAKLGTYYRASDIGVWPSQESTSQIDAAACGIPIVISDRVRTTERIDGNGLAYAEPDPADLAKKLMSLVDPAVRAAMGQRGSARMRAMYSWDVIAAERVRDYERAMRGFDFEDARSAG